MCNPKIKSGHGHSPVAHIDGRLVLHPAGNRVAAAALEHCRTLKKPVRKTPPPTTTNTTTVNLLTSTSPTKLSPPASPKPKASPASAKTVLIKRTNNVDLSSSSEKPISPKSEFKTRAVVRKKSKKSSTTVLAGVQAPAVFTNDLVFLSEDVVGAPGSIAAAQRKQASFLQAQRKMKIAHYGRATSKLDGKVAAAVAVDAVVKLEEKRCSFITLNSDPLYIAYHDEEWGEPVHDDKMLFELLVLTGAQVGLDWSIILRKRNDFREAFAGFDAEVVARFTERQIVSISSKYGLDLGRVRGFVDNANRVLEVRKEFGSLDKYLWGFVNHRPIVTNYKCSGKIPVKTSKSESISKDLVRRGFRFVGPTVIHSFMQAAGLTNDHLTSCPRHLHCSSIASSSSSATTTH